MATKELNYTLLHAARSFGYGDNFILIILKYNKIKRFGVFVCFGS